MIEVLEKVKQAYDKSTTQIDRIIVDKNSYRITNTDYNDDCYEDGNIFGTAIARMLEFEIENSINLEKKEFEYQTGIYIDDKIFWISLGNFIVQDVEPNNTTNKNKVTSMDYMLKSNIKYNSKLDYKSGKITMLDVVKEGCQQSGLELATTDFANNDFIVDSNQFSEDTLIRQVFQAAAQMSGTFAKIRSNNKLYFITPKRKGLLVKEVHKMTVAELNKLPVEKLAACENNYSLSSYKELIVKRNTHPINLVSLGMSDVEGENITLRNEESIAKDGENSLVINDNPFAYTQEKREQLITALFNVVKGFEYTAFEITGQAKPYIETGDEVVVKDKEGNLNQSFLFRFRYKSPNGLESEMSAPSITKATVNYQNVPNATDIAKRTELIVDKQNQTITGLIEQQSETTQKLSEHEQSIDGFKDTVSNIETNLNENYSTTVQMQSLIEKKAGSIESSVSKKVDNIQVGGTNLLPDSAPYNLSEWIRLDDSQVAISLTDEETAPFGKCVRMRLLEEPTGNMGVYIIPTCKTLKAGHEYSFSVWLKATANTDNMIIGYAKGGYIYPQVTTEWKKYTHTFIAETPTSSTHGFCIYAPKGTTQGRSFYIHSAKLEEGNKATAWSPAPDDYYTKIETESRITQTADSITTEVKKKVGNDEIISKINQSAEKVQIDANKISLAGKEIDLTGDNVTIKSDNFSVDKNGNVIVNNIEVNSGKFCLGGNYNNPDFKLIGIEGGSHDDSMENRVAPDGVYINNITSNYSKRAYIYNTHNGPGITLGNNNIGDIDISVLDGYGAKIECPGEVNAHAFNNTSLEKDKKNFEKLKNGLDIIKKIEIYRFNFKLEKENAKKHIGFVIGESYKYSKDITSDNNNSVDLYSMISVAYKAIQEQQEQIENLQKKNEEKDKVIKDLINRVKALEEKEDKQ